MDLCCLICFMSSAASGAFQVIVTGDIRSSLSDTFWHGATWLWGAQARPRKESQCLFQSSCRETCYLTPSIQSSVRFCQCHFHCGLHFLNSVRYILILCFLGSVKSLRTLGTRLWKSLRRRRRWQRWLLTLNMWKQRQHRSSLTGSMCVIQDHMRLFTSTCRCCEKQLKWEWTLFPGNTTQADLSVGRSYFWCRASWNKCCSAALARKHLPNL